MRYEFLEERILRDGIVREGNVLKVDSFLTTPVAFIYISLLALQICTVIICKIREFIL